MNNPKMARAIVNAVQAIIDRSGKAPSHEVQIKAAERLSRPGIRYNEGLVFDIPSDTGRTSRLVGLYADGSSRITGGRCSCEHGADLALGRTCNHLLSALALARYEGYYIDLQ